MIIRTSIKVDAYIMYILTNAFIFQHYHYSIYMWIDDACLFTLVYMHVCVFVHVYRLTYMYVYMGMCACLYICIYVCMHIYTAMFIYIYIYMHICMFGYV